MVIATVSDGLSAVEAVQKHVPDVVLLDVTMPKMNGFEAAQIITDALPQVKVVMVTSHADPAYVEEAFRRGATGYVVKGRLSELLRAIRTVLDGQIYKPQFGR